MSATFKIGCVQCRVKLWIGQNGRIYSDPAYLERLSQFLMDHKGHPLLVADEQSDSLLEFHSVWADDPCFCPKCDPDDA